MFDFWYFELVPPSVCSGALPLLLPLVSAFSGKQPRGSSFDRLVPNLPPADFIKHAVSVQCTCACHGVHRADTSSVLRRASTSTGVLRACVFSTCRTFCKLQQRVSFSPCRAHRLHLHLWWSTSRRHQQFMLHLRLSWCTSRSSEIDSICCELKQILSSKKLGKGHASQIFANSVSLQDNCLVDLDACILFRSNSVIRVNWLLPPHSEIKRAIGCLFCLAALLGQLRRILAHRLSLR